MKSFKYFPLTILLALGIWSSRASAQTLRNVQVDFRIMELVAFNDTMMKLRLRFLESDPMSVSSLSGTIVLGLCMCYCDSIWDQWPRNFAPGSLLGSGTLTYLTSTSSSGGGAFNPGSLGQGGPERYRGTIGIQEVTGGIQRSSEFVLPMTFTLD